MSLTRFVLSALNHLAADTAARLGGTLGVVAWRLHVRRRVANDVIVSTLGITGPQRSAITRRAYATIGANFLELWTIGGPDGPEKYFRALNPNWQKAIHRRHGGLAFVGPHLGSWDLGGYGLSRCARKLLVYAKAQHNPQVDTLANVQRERLGFEVLLTQHGDRGGATRVLREVRSGASIALIADQRPAEEESTPAWFFARPANCHKGPSFFGTRLGVPLVPAFCLRVRAGHSVLFVGRPFTVGRNEDGTQRVMDWFAAMIAAFPGQYFWHHRRFSGSPPQLAERAEQPWKKRGLRLLVDGGPVALGQ